MIRLSYLFIIMLLLAPNIVAQDLSRSQSEIEQKVSSILSKMTLEEKIDMIGGQNAFYIRGYERLGLPALKMADGPVGVRNYGPSTAYPVGIALAASWNPELVNRVGTMIGQEARALPGAGLEQQFRASGGGACGVRAGSPRVGAHRAPTTRPHTERNGSVAR